MPGTEVLLSLHASASVGGEQGETIQLLTTGEWTCQDGAHMIRYEEALDEGSSGTQVLLSLQDGGVTMLRQGAYETNMVFRKGQRYESQYTTPFGTMEMAIFCTKVAYSVQQQGGTLQLQYQLDLNGPYASMHQMEMRFAVKEHDQQHHAPSC